MSTTTRQFEELVQRILVANGFTVRPLDHQGHEAGFDFTGILANEVCAIEAKFYRTARAQASLLEAAASRLAARGREAHASKGMLVVSCVLPPELRKSLEERYGLAFVDRTDLANWASKAPMLVDELNALLELDPSTTPDTTTRSLPATIASKRLASGGPPEDTQGSEMCAELRALKRGKAGWASYEKLCARVLRYLFPNDLHGWHAQRRTDDGLNQFDYVCRVRPTTEFWQFLIDHLNSRYVLFEFKNYSAQVKQGQILTTEKYLLEKGLRRVAIVFTRTGAEKGAVTMAQGAMREHGKLMLILDDDLVCRMLHMKERGEDPTDCLFELADDFLLSLPR